MYWKYFVHSTESDNQELSTPRNTVEIKLPDGEEIKQFYEEIIKLPSQQIEKKSAPKTPRTIKVNQHKPPTPETKTQQPLNIIRFFKAAQNNDVNQLKEYMKSGFDINITDTFNWTALMCASAQGAFEAVHYLVKHGANIAATDKSGRNAVTIANSSGHKNLAQQLTHVETVIKKRNLARSTQTNSNNDNVEFYCGVCEEKFEKTNPNSHQTSTLHLFCSRPEVKDTAVYQIPEHNVGFRLLLKDGWNREKGLGPKEDGRKYPVKTVLKRDRKGLGVERTEKVARVTHFSPGDVKAVENVYRKNEQRKTNTRSQRKRVKNFREKREKRKEKHYRRMFQDN